MNDKITRDFLTAFLHKDYVTFSSQKNKHLSVVGLRE